MSWRMVGSKYNESYFWRKRCESGNRSIFTKRLDNLERVEIGDLVSNNCRSLQSDNLPFNISI